MPFIDQRKFPVLSIHPFLEATDYFLCINDLATSFYLECIGLPANANDTLHLRTNSTHSVFKHKLMYHQTSFATFLLAANININTECILHGKMLLYLLERGNSTSYLKRFHFTAFVTIALTILAHLSLALCNGFVVTVYLSVA